MGCELSRLTIPADRRYAEIAARYVMDVARLIGCDEGMQRQIFEGLRTALPALMAYSFETAESAALDVSCERIPAGLRIVLHDKGLPLGGSAPEEAGPAGQAVARLRRHFDDILLNNLGPGGKEVVLVKHLPDGSLAEYEAACRLDPPDEEEATRPLAAAAAACTVRPMQPSDALEISKTVFKTYGYSYSQDYIYYPEKIIALNATGEVHSALAVTAPNEVVGHCALSLWGDNPRMAELGQGVVVPGYRSQGCFARLTDYLIGVARSRGLEGVFSEAVTVHPFSQKTALQKGLRECALFLCLVPPTVDFKGLRKVSSARGSLMVQFRYLKRPPTQTIYAPARHADMLRAIYGYLEPAAVPLIADPAEQARDEGPAASYHLHLIRSLNSARIRIDRYGPTLVADIRRTLRELCLERWDVIHLILNLSDRRTPYFCRRFEELGFFFAGLLPLGLASGDALILQYLNTACLPVSTIQTASPFASKLVAYVAACNPNT